MPKFHKTTIPLGANNFLSVLEGIEGGFAIFSGIVFGLSFQNISRELLVLSALVGIIVNAFNSSAVRYASEHYIDELDGREKRRGFHYYIAPALVEFAAYTVVSIIIILPLTFVDTLSHALIACILMTLGVLFAAGYYRGSLLHSKPLRDGLEVTMLGALIILVGGFSGWLLSGLVA